MKVLVYGAGVIGQIYGGRLARSGHQVSMLARGHTAELLAARGITLRQRRVLAGPPGRHRSR